MADAGTDARTPSVGTTGATDAPDATTERPPGESDGRRYGGQSAEERRAERRRRLLDTALELYGTEGYQVVSVERLCTEAGVGSRHLYEEFGSREGLLTALYDQVVYGTVEDIMDALSHAGPSARDRALAAISAFVHALLDDPRRGRIQSLEVIGVSDELESHRREILHRYAQMVDAQGASLGMAVEPGPGGCSLRSLALVGGVNELVIEWLHADPTPELETLIDEVVRLFVAAAETEPVGTAMAAR